MSSDLTEAALEAFKARLLAGKTYPHTLPNNPPFPLQPQLQPPSSLPRSSSKWSRPSKDRAFEQEIEWADMEVSLPTYDWKRPRFPVNDESPKLTYIHRQSELAQLEQALDQLTSNPVTEESPVSTPVLGFDMEWPASYHLRTSSASQRTAIIQICSRTLVLIIHISTLIPFQLEGPDSEGLALPKLPKALEALLRREDVLKTGVRIEGDASKLKKEFSQSKTDPAKGPAESGLQTQGLLELSRLARHVDKEHWSDRKFHLISLRELVATYLERSLDKGPARTSDWSKVLSEEQIEYAASDVMAGLEVYEALRRRAEAKTAAAVLGNPSNLVPLRKKRKYSDIVAAPSEETPVKDDESAAERLKETPKTITEHTAGFDTVTLDSQNSSSARPPPPPPLPGFADLVRLCTSSLDQKRPPSAAPGSIIADTAPPTMKPKTQAPDPPPPPPKLLSHQRAFDLWAYGHGREEYAANAFRDGTKPTFGEVSKARNIRNVTTADYILRALVEKRHQRVSAGKANALEDSGSGELPTELKQRLEDELRSKEFLRTRLLYGKWLTRHKVAVPVPDPTSG